MKTFRYILDDWRAPISSMYYDYEVGPASYLAPVVRIKGEITSKKQYKIKNGNLEYAIENDMSIHDEILQKELSSTSDKKMKNIVATIQKEQNQIIRNEKADILVIQGVAGSGKTSIALHRIAFFLYRFKEQMNAKDIVIISPNKVFADYISNVLPELGEQPITEIGFEDIAIELLQDMKFSTGAKQTEMLIDGYDRAFNERVSFKSSTKFLQMLEEYLEYANNHNFEPKDYKFSGYVIEKEYIKKRFLQLSNLAVNTRLKELSSEIVDKIKSMNVIEKKAPSKNQVLKWLTSMCNFTDAVSLYKNFYTYIQKEEYLCFKDELEYADVFPYIYVKMYLEGWEEDRSVKHIIIDEMQDYTLVQYAVINKLYPCKKTILGDFGQNLKTHPSITEMDFRKLYPSMEFVQIFTSYRSTCEIIQLAKRIQPSVRIEPTPRHGEIPKVIGCKDKNAEIQEIIALIKKYHDSHYVTLGIVCKTSKIAMELYEVLSKEYNIDLLTTDSTKFENGITITTIAMAKGLEFDEVIIPHVDNKTYVTEYDSNLLYVACTRAMHKLTLTYEDKLSYICRM